MSDPYHDYWVVYVPYCSSDLWSGTNQASPSTAGYHFLGAEIVAAVLQDLILHHNLLDASKVVLSGCSAGAAGVALNCDRVKDKLPDADFRCVAGNSKKLSSYVKIKFSYPP